MSKKPSAQPESAAARKKRERAIEGARFLVEKLSSVADALERHDHPEFDRDYIEWVARMTKANAGLAHPNPATEDNRHRDQFLIACRTQAAVLKDARRSAGLLPGYARQLAEAAIVDLALDAAEYEQRLRENIGTVESLIEAYASGSNANEIKAVICGAVGWPMTGGAVRQAKHRAKKRKTP